MGIPQPASMAILAATNLVTIPYSGAQSGGIENSDTGDRRQAPSGCIGAGQFDELPIQSLRRSRSSHSSHISASDSAAGHEVRIGEQCLHSLLELAASLCDSRAALQQNGAKLVGQPRERAHRDRVRSSLGPFVATFQKPRARMVILRIGSKSSSARAFKLGMTCR